MSSKQKEAVMQISHSETRFSPNCDPFDQQRSTKPGEKNEHHHKKTKDAGNARENAKSKQKELMASACKHWPSTLKSEECASEVNIPNEKTHRHTKHKHNPTRFHAFNSAYYGVAAVRIPLLAEKAADIPSSLQSKCQCIFFRLCVCVFTPGLWNLDLDQPAPALSKTLRNRPKPSGTNLSEPSGTFRYLPPFFSPRADGRLWAWSPKKRCVIFFFSTCHRLSAWSPKEIARNYQNYTRPEYGQSCP